MASLEPIERDSECQPDMVRSVTRAFALLRLMNSRQYWSLQALNAETGLAKATLWRLLATLRHEGYVIAEDKVGVYRLTSKVRELNTGYCESTLLSDLARKLLIGVTKQIKWPVALGTLDEDCIVVRFTSLAYSPLAIYATTLGQKRQLLDSAMGRSYLAFCSAEQRARLLDHVIGAPRDARESLLATIEKDLIQIRSAGYAVRHHGGTPASSTLAVPVLVQGESIAVLSMTTFPKSMTAATIEKHCPILIETARTIAAEFQSRSA